jgi:hypothetical protein
MQAAANPESTRIPAQLTGLWSTPAVAPAMVAPVTFLAQLALPTYFHTYYGAPGSIWVNVTVAASGVVTLEVQLFNKTSTRLGEAMYLNFATPPVAGSAWFMSVLDYLVDPLDVVIRGSQHQHGVGDGAVYVAPDGSGLAVDTIDAPVRSPWTAQDLPTTLIVPFTPLQGPVEGVASVLFSNIYNTNFPLYSVDDAMKFRFQLRALPSSPDSLVATK